MADPPIETDMGALSDDAMVGDRCTSTPLVCIQVLGTNPDEGEYCSILLSIGTEGLLLVGALLPFRPLPLGASAVANLVILGIFFIAPYDAINASSCLLCSAAATT